MGRKKCKDPPKLPELCGANLLGRICLHPSKSSRIKYFLENCLDDENFDEQIVTDVTAQPPSHIRLREEAKGHKGQLLDRFSNFLNSHPGDRPWRRAEGDLPLWDPNEALANKAAILTAKIASDFCNWYRGLGGDPLIDEDTVQQMFAIHFPEPARGGTRVLVKELKTQNVSKHVLDKIGLPEIPRNRTNDLQNLPRVAFGRCVPRKTNRMRPPSQVPPLPQPPDGLLAMQPVFEDITQLNITQGFCQLLNESSNDIYKPAFLINQGLVIYKSASEINKIKKSDAIIKKKRVSIIFEPPWDILHSQ